MAKTAFATGNALTKKLYEKDLFEDTIKESYFSRFRGTGADSIVQVNGDLKKDKGDRITFGIRMRASGAGVTSGTSLEGAEESLTTYSFNVSLEQYRHAFRDNGALTRQRAVFSIDEESVAALRGWGSEKMDQLSFDTILASPTQFFSRNSGVIAGATSTPAASILQTDLITPGLISFVKTWALTGGARGQTPLRPVKVDGRDYFVLLVHPDVKYDLDIDSTFAQARREAEVRGKENPLFHNSYAIWNNVVIHEHENITLTTTWGGGAVTGAQNVFMGAQSLMIAEAEAQELVSKEFDYGNEHGYAWAYMAGYGKPQFNSLDYGSLAVYTARTNVSGA